MRPTTMAPASSGGRGRRLRAVGVGPTSPRPPPPPPPLLPPPPLPPPPAPRKRGLLRSFLSAGALLCSATCASRSFFDLAFDLARFDDDDAAGAPTSEARRRLLYDDDDDGDVQTHRALFQAEENEGAGGFFDNVFDSSVFDVPAHLGEDDDPDLVLVPPPLASMTPSASESSEVLDPSGPFATSFDVDDVLRSERWFHRDFAVLVYDPSLDQFVAYYSRRKKWRSSCQKLVNAVKMLSHGLRTMFPDRFRPDRPELVLGVSSGDYPGLKAHPSSSSSGTTADDAPPDRGGDDGRSRIRGLALVLHFGSVHRRPSVPRTIAMPMPKSDHLNCFDEWASQRRVCDRWRPRERGKSTGLVFEETVGPSVGSRGAGWDELIPQVIWRGTDFTYLGWSERGLRRPDLRKDVVEPAKGLKDADDPREANVRALRGVYDELIPRWKGVVWTAEAELDAAGISDHERRLSGEGERGSWWDKLWMTFRDQNDGRPKEERETMPRAGPTEEPPIPWANIKFSSAMPGGRKTPALHLESFRQFVERGIPAADAYMSLEAMAHYKYHLDLGGGGGTTWSGTLEKLGLPGLLFHHVTPTKDYLHDVLAPWTHYVPVRADLSDLKAKYEWAESHPRQAKRISDNAARLARALGTPEGAVAMYRRFYEGPLRDAVRAYAPVGGEGDWRKRMEEGKMRPIFRCGGRTVRDCARVSRDGNLPGIMKLPLAKDA